MEDSHNKHRIHQHYNESKHNQYRKHHRRRHRRRRHRRPSQSTKQTTRAIIHPSNRQMTVLNDDEYYQVPQQEEAEQIIYVETYSRRRRCWS
jgi:hypothetical protein